MGLRALRAKALQDINAWFAHQSTSTATQSHLALLRATPGQPSHAELAFRASSWLLLRALNADGVADRVEEIFRPTTSGSVSFKPEAIAHCKAATTCEGDQDGTTLKKSKSHDSALPHFSRINPRTSLSVELVCLGEQDCFSAYAKAQRAARRPSALPLRRP
eukprot:CAMPEP_0180575526 /NCGR_PEP_ID=MMETSP1037_2-20121125/10929_1 /TAXON_ID=632150 /ORGANISM="Azadinium spinosum, Strain 3D9" /LENGTH=161 /DNA_ID=CAMNT_0022593175 /DNA_START=379 /DNA_END=865 /DNA_ORIENTATION=+